MRSRSFLLGLWIAAAAILGAESSASAQEGVYGDVSAEDVAQVLKREGFPIERDIDAAGDPIIWSRLGGRRFGVFFYRCRGETERRCADIQFFAGFDIDGRFPETAMNAWNANVRFGRGYIDDEGDPRLEMDVITVGSTEFLLRESLLWWQTLMADFETFIAASLPEPVS